MSRPRLPPHERRNDAPELDADSFPRNSDDDLDEEQIDVPDDFDEYAVAGLGAIETLLDFDDDYEALPEPGDFWIQGDDA